MIRSRHTRRLVVAVTILALCVVAYSLAGTGPSPSAPERYQIFSRGEDAWLLDTQSGQVWLWEPPKTAPSHGKWVKCDKT